MNTTERLSKLFGIAAKNEIKKGTTNIDPFEADFEINLPFTASDVDFQLWYDFYNEIESTVDFVNSSLVPAIQETYSFENVKFDVSFDSENSSVEVFMCFDFDTNLVKQDKRKEKISTTLIETEDVDDFNDGHSVLGESKITEEENEDFDETGDDNDEENFTITEEEFEEDDEEDEEGGL